MKFLINCIFFWLLISLQLASGQKFKYVTYSGEDLPFGFDNRYRSFMLPKSQAIFEDLNLKLIEIIQEPTWNEVLANYTSESK